MLRLTVVLVAVLGLALIAVFTPVIPLLGGVLGLTEETQQPAVTPTEPSQLTEPSQPAEPSQLMEPSPPAELPQQEEVSPGENALVFSEKELQDKMDELIDRANQSGEAEIEYIRVKLEEDRMLVSTKGEALGLSGETENLTVRFEGRTMFASGKVNAFGFNPTLTAEVEIYTEEGKPGVEVKSFKLGALPLKLLGLTEAKISEIINSAIESRGVELPAGLESIRIEDGELIVVYE